MGNLKMRSAIDERVSPWVDHPPEEKRSACPAVHDGIEERAIEAHFNGLLRAWNSRAQRHHDCGGRRGFGSLFVHADEGLVVGIVNEEPGGIGAHTAEVGLLRVEGELHSEVFEWATEGKGIPRDAELREMKLDLPRLQSGVLAELGGGQFLFQGREPVNLIRHEGQHDKTL